MEIAAMSRIDRLAAGAGIPYFNDPSNSRAYYLASGQIQLLCQDGSDRVVSAGDEASRHPLGGGRLSAIQAVALSNAEIVVVDSDMVDIFMTWEQVPSQSSPDISREARFFAGMSAAQSSLLVAGTRMDMGGLSSANKAQGGAFSRLPSASIDGLFQRLTSVAVKAGQVIVRQGDEGDFYYLIESGRAIVTRSSNLGGPPAVIARLSDGDAFGEEAPVSDNRRNATVTMETDGILLRLSKQDFIELLKEPLLNSVSLEAAEQMVVEGAQWIDVRLPSEFDYDHLPSALNLPLYEIREALSSLDKGQRYITYCRTGRRSSAAAFLMSQLGFNVYMLDGGTQGGGEQ